MKKAKIKLSKLKDGYTSLMIDPANLDIKLSVFREKHFGDDGWYWSLNMHNDTFKNLEYQMGCINTHLIYLKLHYNLKNYRQLELAYKPTTMESHSLLEGFCFGKENKILNEVMGDKNEIDIFISFNSSSIHGLREDFDLLEKPWFDIDYNYSKLNYTGGLFDESLA